MSVGKFISRALGDVGQVLLPVIGIAAAVFTGGAALGLFGPMLAGGIGATAVAGLGIAGDTLLGSALAAAVVPTAIGAAVGGIGAAISGKPILQGIGTGAAIGGIGGAAMGALGYSASGAAADAANIPSSVDITGSPAGFGGGGVGSVGDGISSSVGITPRVGILPPNAPLPTANVPTPATAGGGTDPGWFSKTLGTPQTAAGTTQGSGVMGFLSSPAGGAVIKGIGSAFSSQADADAVLQADQAKRDFYTNNYTVGSQKGLFGGQPNTPGSRTPGQAFAGSRLTGHYEFDPVQRKIVFVPPQQGA